MSFTYSPDLSIPLNFVRFKLNDKDPDDYSFEDEEITYFISKTLEPTDEVTLLKLCANLLRQEIRRVSLLNMSEVGGRDEVERADVDSLKLALQMLEEEIKGGSKTVLAAPSYGGVVKEEVISNRENPSLIEAKFYHGRVPTEYETNRSDVLCR